MGTQKRLLVAILIATGVVFLWYVVLFPPRPAAHGPDGGVDAGAAAATPDLEPSAVAASPDAAAQAAPAAFASPLPGERPPEQLHRLRTDRIEVTLSSWGGALKSAVLFGDKMRRRVDGKEGQVDLVQAAEGTLVGAPLSTAFSGLDVPIDAAYDVELAVNGAQFRYEGPDARVVKRYELRGGSYTLDASFEVTRVSGDAQPAILTVLYPAWVNPATQSRGSLLTPQGNLTQAICNAGTTVERWMYDKDKAEKRLNGPVRWAGIDELYFLAAVVPHQGEGTSCVLSASRAGDFLAKLEVPLGTLGEGATAIRSFSVFLGPKDIGLLDGASRVVPAITTTGKPLDARLDTSVDFSVWAALCKPLLWIMRFFHGLFGKWGIAIVLLTLVVKVILFPLTYKQMVSMEGLRKLQPKMEELRKKHAEDKERMNLELMKLYKEHNVNPLGGCLPILLQMPVWFALYRTLQTSFELYRSHFAWVEDLTQADPYYVLPLAMGVTMFVTQKMQPVAGDPTQAKIMLYVMPVFFTFLMLQLPSGLTLYIFTNNLLSIAQQWYLRRKFEHAPPSKPKPAR